MKLIVLSLVLLVAVRSRGDALYHVHPLSEAEILETYSDMMRDACRHADQFWEAWSADPRGGFWGSGRSDNMNEGIRAVSGMTLTCAALLKYSDALNDSERAEYRRKAIAAIRYATASHLTGGRTCTDGKPWGNSWQSAMWTGDLAFGAWLIWDGLDDGLRKDLERVVAFESDRFLAGRPLAGRFNDTKAEENGWNLICLAVAANMFPDNPHHAAWRTKAIEYMMNTLSTPGDAEEGSAVNGRPVKEWFTGANIHPDFTLENHGFFHPGYVGCSSYFLTQTAMYFTFGRQPIPAAASHHLMDTWGMFAGILLPNGESAYPQGMDWELHGLPYVNVFGGLACWQRDRLAAHLEEVYLQYMRAWQLMENGDLAVAGSRLGFTRHAICAEQATYGYLAHKIFGPPAPELTAEEVASLVEGVHTHDWIETVTHRTGYKFASFSWTNWVMGMLMPIGPYHDGNPDFTVPIVNGLVGSFELGSRARAKPVVLDYSWSKTGDGFETSGTLLRGGGQLKQTLTMTSIGDKTVVYQDRVVALSNLTVKQELGVPIGIENDIVTGGRRLATYSSGARLFNQQKPRGPMRIPGSWANVDSRLGVVMVAGSGLNYTQATNYAPGISVCTDTLYASYSKRDRSFKAGQEVARRVALLFVEVTPDQTAALARSFKMEGQTLKFRTPEGRETAVPLR